MPKKEMTVAEYERMTKTPYRSKFNNADYGPEALGNLDIKEFTYTGEGADENKAGAGRGKQGGPTAKELEGKKTGGAIKAKGWGKARGARAAKYY